MQTHVPRRCNIRGHCPPYRGNCNNSAHLMKGSLMPFMLFIESRPACCMHMLSLPPVFRLDFSLVKKRRNKLAKLRRDASGVHFAKIHFE